MRGEAPTRIKGMRLRQYYVIRLLAGIIAKGHPGFTQRGGEMSKDNPTERP